MLQCLPFSLHPTHPNPINLQPHPPITTGGTSLFSTPPASDATPDIASLSARQLRFGSGPFEAQLLRAGSYADDAMLAAAAGVPAFPGAFPSQVCGWVVVMRCIWVCDRVYST